MESHSTPLTELPAQEDEFAVGKENALNRAFFRFVNWLFRGPYLPADSIWFLAALAMIELGLLIICQPRGYWVDSTISPSITFIGAPLKWGLWAVLALSIAYIFLVVLISRAVNLKIAFPLWVVLCLLHMGRLLGRFGVSPYILCETELSSQWDAIVILIAGIIWAFAVVRVGKSGIIPIFSKNQSIEALRYPRLLQYFSIAGIALVISVTILVALQPQPEWKKIEEGDELSDRPPARMYAALAYDPNQQVAILFGGNEGWTPENDWPHLGDTWQWDGENWMQLHSVSQPSPRRAPVMAYDVDRRVVVLFGGVGRDENKNIVYLDDTWEWDGESWIEKHPEISPPARGDANMYYDPSRRKVILYGGWYGDGGFFDDVWEFDGQTWSKIFLEESRESSNSTIIFFEPERAPLLMDGQGVWTLRDSRWYQPNHSFAPPGRWASSITYDHQLQQAVLFGGELDGELFDDTWIFDGLVWNKIITKNQPTARFGSNMYFDARRNRVVLFGGYDGSIVFNDQWELVLP